MPNYWVVGAMWGGHDDQSDKFIRRGYWYLGYKGDDQPDQQKRRDQVRPGDRIAIKRMLGRGSPDIEIRALGVVREIDEDDKRIYIDWLVRDVKRQVPGNGCFASIHGPFTEDESWTTEVFRI
jgi:hypothetical protein